MLNQAVSRESNRESYASVSPWWQGHCLNRHTCEPSVEYSITAMKLYTLYLKLPTLQRYGHCVIWQWFAWKANQPSHYSGLGKWHTEQPEFLIGEVLALMVFMCLHWEYSRRNYGDRWPGSQDCYRTESTEQQSINVHAIIKLTLY